MAIGADDGIWKFGTQDEVSSSPGTIADNAYLAAGLTWTNDDDATDAAAVLKVQFDTTMPTVGNLLLYARLLNVQSTNDEEAVDANNPINLVGSFTIDYGVAADVDFYTTIPNFQIPVTKSSQEIDFYLLNNATGQTVGTSWQLWITPKSVGPHA